MADAVLVFPKTGNDVKNASIELPVSLLSIAGYLQQSDYEVKIIDSRLDDSWDKTLQAELDKHPRIVCISSMKRITRKLRTSNLRA